MKRKGAGFDTLFLSLTLALCFSIGFGIGGGSGEGERHSLIIELSLTEKKGKFGEDEGMMIDGREKAELVYLSDTKAHIRVNATLESAGWLLSSGKYISENQPVKFFSAESYLEGRVNRISKSP